MRVNFYMRISFAFYKSICYSQKSKGQRRKRSLFVPS